MLTNASIALHQNDLALASLARLKQPNPMISDEVRPVLARMSLLTSQLAEDAATALEHQDPLSGCRLAVAEGLLSHHRTSSRVRRCGDGQRQPMG